MKSSIKLRKKHLNCAVFRYDYNNRAKSSFNFNYMLSEMSKLPIKDPSVKIIPAPAFRKLVSSRFSRDPLLPQAIQNICKNNLSKCTSRIEEEPGKPVEFSEEEREFLKDQNEKNLPKKSDLDDVENDEPEKEPEEILKTAPVQKTNTLTLSLNDLKWLHQALNRLRKDDPEVPYLHELMQDCEIILPENEIQERNPELEARCQKLRKQQEAKEYEAMTRNVDNVRTLMPQDTIAYQSKHPIFSRQRGDLIILEANKAVIQICTS